MASAITPAAGTSTASTLVGTYTRSATMTAAASVGTASTLVGSPFEVPGGSGVIAYSAQADASHSYPHGVYGLGVYAFLKDSTDEAFYSTDNGATWNSGPLVQAGSWQSGMAFGNVVHGFGSGYFVTARYNSDQLSASYDNIDWEWSEYGVTGNWVSTRFVGNQFVVVGQNKAQTSPDGASWTERTVPTAFWRDVAYGNGVFVAVSSSMPGETWSNIVMRSTDGVTWNSQAMGVSGSFWYKIAFGNGVFVAYCNGWNGTEFRSVIGTATSADGITWTLHEDVLGAGTAVHFVPGSAIIVSSTQPTIWTSTDGAVWTERTLPYAASSVFVRSTGLIIPGPPGIPANNRITEAHTISGGVSVDSYTGDTSLSTAGWTTGETVMGGASSEGFDTVWFVWRALGSGAATFNTLGSSFDTTLRVFSGTSASLNALSLITENDDSDALGYTTESLVSFYATAGTTYYVQLAGNAAGISGAYMLSWTLPPPISYGYFPMPELRIGGGDQVINDITVALPALSAQILGAARLRASPPALKAQITGTTTILVQIDVDLPMLTVSISGTRTGSAQVAGTFPSPTVAARGAARVDAPLPPLQLVASATTGSVIGVRVTLPKLTGSFSMTAEAFGAIEAALPMLVAGPYGRIVSMLPMSELVLSGRTVVAVTYEAYAINLKHVPKPRVEPTDEVTRYTNYPFNQIVRFGSSYFGVADDGLYLLGGATDHAVVPTAIPWALKTAMTDDKTPFKKRVTAVRFAGRVGPEATVTLFVSEPDANAYSYVTPRDADPQNYRQKLGRGTKARYYALGMAGDGELELDTLEPEVEILTRKL